MCEYVLCVVRVVHMRVYIVHMCYGFIWCVSEMCYVLSIVCVVHVCGVHILCVCVSVHVVSVVLYVLCAVHTIIIHVCMTLYVCVMCECCVSVCMCRESTPQLPDNEMDSHREPTRS